MNIEGKSARDIMQGDVISVDKDCSLERIITLIEKNNITKIPVIENEKLTGLVSDEEIVDKLGSVRTRRISPSSMHVSSVMIRDFDFVKPDEDLSKMIEMCKGSGIAMFPVVDDGTLVGVITKSDILPFVDTGVPVGDIMTKNLRIVARANRIIHARRLMVDNGIERLPVLEEGKLVGIITSTDIALFLYEFRMRVDTKYQHARMGNLLVEHAMKKEPITIDSDTTAKKAAELMYQENVGCLPVIDSLGRIEGIITRTDLIKTIPAKKD